MAFFNKPTNKKPQTRPQSAPASRRRRKMAQIQFKMPNKGDNGRGKGRYPRQ